MTDHPDAPNYVQEVLDELAERLPDCGTPLLELYALLALTAGTGTTLEDVHQAWAVWRNRTRPDHPSLVPFAALAPEVRELDRKYAEAIREVAAEFGLGSETELEHRIGQATEEAESMALEGGVARECALRFLAALEVTVAEWPAAPESNAGAPGAESPAPGPPEPVAAIVASREALREAISAAIDDAWWSEGPKPSERVMGIVWPVLEHAQEAAAGSHEGVRLWMLDCGELAAKHRARAEAAEGKLRQITDYAGRAVAAAAAAERKRFADGIRPAVTGLIGMWDGMRNVTSMTGAHWAAWREALGGFVDELASRLPENDGGTGGDEGNG